MNDIKDRRKISVAFAVAFLVASCAAVSAQEKDNDWSGVPEIFPGVRFVQIHAIAPRPTDLYAMQIDSRNPHIRFHTTGRHTEWIENSAETQRTTTRDFMRESRAAGMNMIAAINADAFQPWPAPWDQRTLTDLRGLAVSEGVVVSPAGTEPSFVVFDDGRAAIVPSLPNLDHVRTAISGFAIVLAGGVPVAATPETNPRTGIGLSEDARYVVLLVIDGRRHASQGATTEEVGRWLLHFGAYTGINLDGGGSATLVRFDESAPGDGVVVLNHPVGDGTVWLKVDEAVEKRNYVPAERANGNNLGVYLVSE
jgi:hypothetical protein